MIPVYESPEVRIRSLRIVAGLSQGQLAQRIGVTHHSLNLVEAGVREGRAAADEVFDRVCEFFGVSRDWLATGKGPAGKNGALLRPNGPWGEESLLAQIATYLPAIPGSTDEDWARLRELILNSLDDQAARMRGSSAPK